RSTASVRTGRAQSTPRAAPLRTRGGCSYGSGLGWFCCRSTASVRMGRARIRTRGGCSYGSGVGLVFVVGAPPRCERGRAQTLLTHTSPCTTSQPRHPLLYSCPDNPLDISKSPIQEAQCRVTSNLPIPPSASWACVRDWQAVPH